jgi:hypothetical protein
MSSYRNCSVNSTVPTEISGLQVTRQRRAKRQRAELAAAIMRGEVRLTHLTQTQTAKVCSVSASYVSHVRRGQRRADNVVELALDAAE